MEREPASARKPGGELGFAAVAAAKQRLTGRRLTGAETPLSAAPEQELKLEEPQVIGVGSVVTIEYIGESKTIKVMLVEEKTDSNPEGVNFQITMSSPMARRIIGEIVSEKEIIVSPYDSPEVRVKILKVTNP